ncbi:GAD-like domain protein [compost metagenome]
MRDPDFAYFIEKFGEATFRIPVPETSIEKWSDKLPPVLMDYWREEGWASYRGGLLWTVDPEHYESVKDAWLEDTPFSILDKFHVVARSAFGDLFLCGESTGRSVTIVTLHSEILALPKNLKKKSLSEANSSIQSFFGSRRPESFDYKDTSGKLLFERAKKKYGPLAPDEMYGFEPALVLGGSATLKNLRRLKLDPHLLILREFDTPTLPFSNVDLDKLMK